MGTEQMYGENVARDMANLVTLTEYERSEN